MLQVGFCTGHHQTSCLCSPPTPPPLNAPPTPQVKDITRSTFDQDFDQLMAHLKTRPTSAPAAPRLAAAEEAPGSGVGREDLRRCFFGDYMDVSAEPADRSYSEVGVVMGAGRCLAWLIACIHVPSLCLAVVWMQSTSMVRADMLAHYIGGIG
jgi:hypothetical protein